jgi:uncharacterized protein YgbK (DUF1537 family)
MNDRLLCFYGDDFTGSTDALEALASNGVNSVLFLEPVTEARLAHFPGCRAIGIAGESRSRSPEWMSSNLPDLFRALKSYGAPVCQYKVCSTFDSSTQHGSIGRAIEIGQDIFGNSHVPIAVAAPHLKRYVLFGNLFAAGPGGIYRIDRHPSMARHPVTPMDEADLRLHLSRQTDRKIALLDITAVHGPDPEGRLRDLLESERPRVVLFDGYDETSLAICGRLMWSLASASLVFAVGSSGLTHALIRHWRKIGIVPEQFTPPTAEPADRLIVASGSCSPVTEHQIRWAMRNGFEAIRVDPAVRDSEALQTAALDALSSGRSIVVYTALGPEGRGAIGGADLGSYLGRIVRSLIVRSGVRRAIIAGGDTSTHSVREFGIHALTFKALTTPGAPLCQCHSTDPALNGLEVVLKGGQVGPENYFAAVRDGM